MPDLRWFNHIRSGLYRPIGQAALTLAMMISTGASLIAEEHGVSVRLTTYDREDYRGELRITAGKTEWAKFEYQGTAKQLEVPDLLIPAATRTLSFQGNLAWMDDSSGAQVSRGNSQRQIVEITELMRPIRDGRLKWSARLEQLQKAQESFESRHSELGAAVNPRVEQGERDTAAEITAANRRLGFALPPDHVQLLLDAGAWSVNDSSLTAARDLNPAFQQMIELWETPSSDMNTLPEDIKAFLRSSVILFTEAGDGYSALICHAGKQDINPADYRYYWLTQDEINRPQLLADRDGRPFDHGGVMSWLLGNQLIRIYEDAGTDAVLVDFRAPVPLEYNVELLLPASRTIEARLLLDWQHFR